MAIHSLAFVAIKNNIDPRASLFVIFVLLLYITGYDLYSRFQRRNKI